MFGVSFSRDLCCISCNWACDGTEFGRSDAVVEDEGSETGAGVKGIPSLITAVLVSADDGGSCNEGVLAGTSSVSMLVVVSASFAST